MDRREFLKKLGFGAGLAMLPLRQTEESRVALPSRIPESTYGTDRLSIQPVTDGDELSRLIYEATNHEDAAFEVMLLERQPGPFVHNRADLLPFETRCPGYKRGKTFVNEVQYASDGDMQFWFDAVVFPALGDPTSSRIWPIWGAALIWPEELVTGGRVVKVEGFSHGLIVTNGSDLTISW